MSKVLKYKSINKIFKPACTDLGISQAWPKLKSDTDYSTGPIFGKLSKIVETADKPTNVNSVLNATLFFVQKLNLSIFSEEFKEYNIELPDNFRSDLKALVEKLRKIALIVGGLEVLKPGVVIPLQKKEKYHKGTLVFSYQLLPKVISEKVLKFSKGLPLEDDSVSEGEFLRVKLDISDHFDPKAIKRLSSGFEQIADNDLAVATTEDREAASKNARISALTGIIASLVIPVSVWAAGFMSTIASLKLLSAIVVTSASLAIYFYIRFRQLESATKIMSAKLDEAREALNALIPASADSS